MDEALIARIRRHIQKAEFMGLREADSTLLLREAANVIETLSAADVVPVVHGRWLGKDYYNDDRPVPYDPNAHGQRGCFCSECGLHSLLSGNEEDVPSNYCPNCGAKMDGGADND